MSRASPIRSSTPASRRMAARPPPLPGRSTFRAAAGGLSGKAVLIVNGEYDVIFRLGARRFVGGARNVRRVRIRGAMHLADLDRPEAFTTAVRRFVDGLGERS